MLLAFWYHIIRACHTCTPCVYTKINVTVNLIQYISIDSCDHYILQSINVQFVKWFSIAFINTTIISYMHLEIPYMYVLSHQFISSVIHSTHNTFSQSWIHAFIHAFIHSYVHPCDHACACSCLNSCVC